MNDYKEYPIVNVPNGKTLRVRPATAATYATANPILKETDLGYTTDTNVIKIGDGSTAWNDLPAINGDGGGGSSFNGLLIEHGADVPDGTPVGAIIFEKAE